jgi:hypothetical protein
MSRKLHLVDYITIQPDKNISKLSKSDKHRFMDSVLNAEDNMMSGSPKGLEVIFNLSHSARKINNRIYPPLGQRDGLNSWLSPYPKPILLNHDMEGDPIGRFTDMKWISLESEAIEFFRSTADFMSFKKAFDDDDPQMMYKMLRKHRLLNNDRWPGLSKLQATARITDSAAIEKFLDGRYLTFSAGSHTDKYRCGVCGSGWHEDDICEHRPGRMTEDGDLAVFITGTFYGREGSVVNGPADNLGYVESLRQVDSAWLPSEISCEIDGGKADEQQVIMTDSQIVGGQFTPASRLSTKEEFFEALSEFTNEYMRRTADGTSPIQKEEKDKEEEEEEQVDKKHDHTLSISTSEMEELHEKGETMVTTSSGSETMVIRVVFEGYKQEREDADALIEILEDEKKFKVPAGAKGNAQKVLDWKKKYGSEVKGMTAVGWARARQLASQSEIPLSTVKRMAAFNRHRKNAAVDPKFKSEPWKDRGYVAWLGWGGTSGVDWAIKISAANDSEESDAPIEDAKKTGASTPAKPSERIKGSKKNKKGSAKSANKNIAVGSVLESLKEKVSSHNKKHGDKKGKRVTLGMLKAVYRRGAGAFSTSHRPGMSRSGWGVARVNAFLHLVRTGSPKNSAYKQDNDLLPAGHPKKSE